MAGERHFTTFGSVGTQERPNEDVSGGTVAGTQPGFIRLVNQAGSGFFLWVDNGGDLRINATIPADPDSDGTIVGTQS